MTPADIFLSYAHEDLEQARGLAESLSALGWPVFWDRHIPPGRTFEEYLEERVRECRALVVMWSPHSSASRWVKIEASYGRRRGILIPVLVAATEIPFGYDDIHAADLTGWRPGTTSIEFDELVSALEVLAPRAAYALVMSAAGGDIRSHQEINSSTHDHVLDPPASLNQKPAWFTPRQRLVAIRAASVAILLVASWAVYRGYRAKPSTQPSSTTSSSHGAVDSGTPSATGPARGSGSAVTNPGDAIGPKPAEPAVLAAQRCDSGDAASCTELGDWYLGGERGLTKNVASATNRFRQACDHGDANGCDRLGDRYRLGDSGFPKDLDFATALYRKACDGRSPSGCAHLGERYFYGEGGLPKDVVRARALFKRACDAGAPSGCEHLGTIAAAETTAAEQAAEARRRAAAARQNDQQSVRNVLEQYRSAYNNLDAKALSRVASGAAAQVDFTVYRSYTMTLSDIAVQIDGDSAVVRCTRRIDATSRRGNERLQPPPQTVTMKMRRTASSWIIESVS
jgi:TPR repeat protein